MNKKILSKKQEDAILLEENWLYKLICSTLTCPVLITERVEDAKRAVGTADDIGLIGAYLIISKSQTTSAVGGATAIPGVIPVIGTIGTIVASVGAELLAVTKLEIELCLEMAALGGKDISSRQRVFEILTIIDSCCGKNPAMDDELIRTMTGRAVKTGLVRMLKKVSNRLGFKIFKKTVVKVIPFLGIPLGAVYNLRTTKEIGRIAMKYYCGVIKD